jgi:hypothetical protein
MTRSKCYRSSVSTEEIDRRWRAPPVSSLSGSQSYMHRRRITNSSGHYIRTVQYMFVFYHCLCFLSRHLHFYSSIFRNGNLLSRQANQGRPWGYYCSQIRNPTLSTRQTKKKKRHCCVRTYLSQQTWPHASHVGPLGIFAVVRKAEASVQHCCSTLAQYEKYLLQMG